MWRTGNAKKRKKYKEVLFTEQKGKCWLCGSIMLKQQPKHLIGREPLPEYATFEHIKPFSQGGKFNRQNIKLTHRKCNRERGNNV